MSRMPLRSVSYQLLDPQRKSVRTAVLCAESNVVDPVCVVLIGADMLHLPILCLTGIPALNGSVPSCTVQSISA